MAFSPQFLDELRNRLSVSGVVGKRVKLTRRGHEHQGLCPFHNEKTPSFTVNDDKGFYHCFGCGAHGSAIDFVMETEGVPFPEAVERLATDAGLEVPRDTPEERARAKVRKDLFGVLELATAFFENQLRMPQGAKARSYLADRGLTNEVITSFRLGFAPDSRTSLKTALAREGVEEAQLIAAGLVIKPDDGRPGYDRFRGRVIFPIADQRGRIIAFGGRILGDGEPKYLNSPETDVFHKGRELYGLDRARRPARDAGTLLVTEGYMDVIALAQAGFAHAVAPLGTALTEDQIDRLWSVVDEPTLCFDGDNAGQRAALRAANRALPKMRAGVGLRFIELPAGEDPDTLVRSAGPEAFRQLLREAKPLSEVIWNAEIQGRALTTPEERARADKNLKDQANRIADDAVRMQFLNSFKNRLWELGRGARGGKKGGAWGGAKRDRNWAGGGGTLNMAGSGSGSGTKVDHHRLQERILMAGLLNHPALIDQVDERLGSLVFAAPDLDKLRQEALKSLAGDPNLDSGGLQSHLRRSGFSSQLDDLLSANLFKHAFFTKSDVAQDTVLVGWNETYALYRQRDLKAEIRAVQKRLEQEMTVEDLETLNELRTMEQEQSAGGDYD